MDIHIDLGSGGGRRDEIYRQIREAILVGRLRPGEALPPTRELARRLAISRNTVGAAYDRLSAEGFLDARVGVGTFVRTGSTMTRDSRDDAMTSLEPAEVWSAIPNPPPPFHPRPDFDFRAGLPDVGLFPFPTWRRLLTQQVRHSRPDVLTYGDPRGHPALVPTAPSPVRRARRPAGRCSGRRGGHRRRRDTRGLPGRSRHAFPSVPARGCDVVAAPA